jgi:hypothetical protein
MTRSGKAEIEQRVDELYDLVVARVSYRVIVGYATKKWGVSERQTCRYLAYVRARIADLLSPTQAEHLARALASYESLYAKQVAGSRYGEARQTLDSIVRLLGLAAPEKVEVYDFSAYSDQQLAVEVAHELPELIREAERLTHGTAATDTDASDQDDNLDPAHPDA